MKLYAGRPGRRLAQMFGDLTVAGWVLLWLWLGRTVHDATLALAVPGREIDGAATSMAERIGAAGERLDDLPMVGDEVRSPLDGASSAASDLAAAGRAQVRATETLADWLGLAVTLTPVLVVLALYLPARIRFVRRATAARAILDRAADLDLFALRALAHQPLDRLARISADPAAAWRAGDPEAVRRLADLELRDVGLPVPAVREER